MKTKILLLAAALLGGSISLAEVPDAVLAQLRTDLRPALLVWKPGITSEEIAWKITAFEKQISDPASDASGIFAFSQAELEAFVAEKPVPSDDDLTKAVAEISALTSMKKAPHLLVYYETLRSAGKLTARQKIIHQRICRGVISTIREQLGKSDKKQPQ